MSLQNNRRYWGSSIFWKQLPALHTKPWRTGVSTTNRACATTSEREVHARSKIALRPLPLRKGTFGLFEGVFIAVFLRSIPFQSKIPMARPGYSRVGGALVMAASSVLGYLGQARLEDVPFWSVVYALVTIHCGHSMLLFPSAEGLDVATHVPPCMRKMVTTILRPYFVSPLSCYRNGCLDRLH